MTVGTVSGFTPENTVAGEGFLGTSRVFWSRRATWKPGTSRPRPFPLMSLCVEAFPFPRQPLVAALGKKANPNLVKGCSSKTGNPPLLFFRALWRSHSELSAGVRRPLQHPERCPPWAGQKEPGNLLQRGSTPGRSRRSRS